MSTLGTFAKYASFAGETGKKRGRPKKSNTSAGQMEIPIQNPTTTPSGLATKSPVATPQYRLGETNVPSSKLGNNLPYKSKRRVAMGKKSPEGFGKLAKLKKLKTRNIIIGSGLGLAGLGTAGAIAYNNRNASRNSEMSANSAYANFASLRADRTAEEIAKADASIARKRKLVKPLTETGNADADAAIKSVRDIARDNRRKEVGKLNKQRAIERNVDSGGDVYKGAKGAGDYLARTSALLTSPERMAIQAGKNSKNGFVSGLAEGAEKFGKAGYKEGATGLRKVGNALVGRTVTGKVARLGAAGLGLSAIGGAMKRNRQERG